VRQRFSDVKKALHLHPFDPKASELADEVVELAWKHAENDVRVIVYVRGPADAKKVRDGLTARLREADKGGDPWGFIHACRYLCPEVQAILLKPGEPFTLTGK
jgi:hypothetical protein